jgi:hypothetical protein
VVCFKFPKVLYNNYPGEECIPTNCGWISKSFGEKEMFNVLAVVRF